MELIVTVDTEADYQWRRALVVTTENILYLRPFQELCARFGVRPTYLITSEIALDPRGGRFLKPLVDEGLAEVGAHLHPWTTPPFFDTAGLRYNDPVHLFPSELGSELFRMKMENLTGQIFSVLGTMPRSYRAGRFGYDDTCAATLSRLGYLVDSSVTPLVSWREVRDVENGGWPDFSKKSLFPYSTVTDGFPFLEIPITIAYTSRLLQKHPRLSNLHNLCVRIAGRVGRFSPRPLQPFWLRPLPGMGLKDLAGVWRAAERLGAPFGVMMLHSSELMPAGSPYRPSVASVNALLELLEGFFKFVRNTGAGSVTLFEAGENLKAGLHESGPVKSPGRR